MNDEYQLKIEYLEEQCKLLADEIVKLIPMASDPFAADALNMEYCMMCNESEERYHRKLEELKNERS